MIGAWIETTDQLPPMGVYVLARYSGTNWLDSDDQANVNCVVVKRRPVQLGGNHQVPYCYNEFGPSQFFGHQIVAWIPLPEYKP